MREFLRSFVENDAEYQENLKERLRAGKTPHMELLAAPLQRGETQGPARSHDPLPVARLEAGSLEARRG